MDKETKALIDFYDNKIKNLEDKNKEKQDKLDKIKNLVEIVEMHLKGFEFEADENYLGDERNKLNEVLQIIKGEDK